METTLFRGTDSILNVEYRFIKINAIELSNKLKSSLIDRGIDYNECIISKENVYLPNGVYEYQNFAIIEDNNEYFLLDGFRRLLWNESVPNIDIHVKVYSRATLSDSDIIKIIIELNHQKFNGGMGLFFDRGFALCMKTFFGIDLKRINKMFDGYIAFSKDNYGYIVSKYDSESLYESCIAQLLKPNFVSDMKFLMSMRDANVVTCDRVFGTMLKNVRNANPDIIFDVDEFITKINSNDYIMDSIQKHFTSKNSKGDEIGNMLIKHYKNVLVGGNELSFIEKIDEAKAILKKLKSDKKLTAYTNSTRINKTWERNNDDVRIEVNGIVEDVLAYHNINGRYPSVKVLIMPSQKDNIKYGLYDDFYIVGVEDIKYYTGYGTMGIYKQRLIVKNDSGLLMSSHTVHSGGKPTNLNNVKKDNDVNDAYLFIDEIKK